MGVSGVAVGSSARTVAATAETGAAVGIWDWEDGVDVWVDLPRLRPRVLANAA